ncbi:hypothetical protein [Thalassotalea litorea]|uniref:hypothetical protein n=1 Tax=Thalassotalea litorea TaxID=2020715 RepID=UPI0037369154
MSILKFLKSQFKLAKNDIKYRKLRSDLNGVYLGDKQLFKWNEVKLIEAYKEDLFTVDLICLDITLISGIQIKLHEELKGFSEFRERMESVLLLNNKSWMASVMLPPFEECRTQVFNLNTLRPDVI